MRTTRGFTLIELLVVVALIAIVSGLAMPIAYRNMSGFRARAAARELAATFRLARDMAIASRTQHSVHFDEEEGHYLLQRDESKGRRLFVPEEEIERLERMEERKKDRSDSEAGAGAGAILEKELGQGVGFLRIEVDRDDEEGDHPLVFFDPRGNSSGGDLVLGGERAAWRVELFRAGGRTTITSLGEDWRE